MMDWLEIGGWVLVAVMALGSLLSIVTVGEDRKPLTGGAAAWVVLINIIFIIILVGLISR